MSASTDLTFALTHAIAFLTRSLIGRYSATTIDLLHFTLERNLTKLYENNWFPNEPQRGAGRRCLTLIPNAVPPRPIYFACKSARVNWNDWMSCLGNVETHLFIDPGCVSVRFGAINKSYIVWSAGASHKRAASSPSPPPPPNPTIAQSILTGDDDDDDENEIFNMIANEIRAPTWKTPVHTQFPNLTLPPAASRYTSLTSSLPKLIIPNQTRLSKPSSASNDSAALLSVGSSHSRSSSRSSLSDASGFSFSSVDSASTTATSFGSPASLRVSPKSSTKGKDVSFLLPAAALVMQAPEMDDDDDGDLVVGVEAVESIALTVTTPMGTHHATAARVPRVVVDATKKEVTPYDGGKTTVLTGGVMLGMKSPAAAVSRFTLAPGQPPAARQSNWRGAVAAGPVRA